MTGPQPAPDRSELLAQTARFLDATRDLIDQALEHTRHVQASLRDIDGLLVDLHWEVARMVMDPDEPPTWAQVHAAGEPVLARLDTVRWTAIHATDRLDEAAATLKHGRTALEQVRAARPAGVAYSAEVALLGDRFDRLTALLQHAIPAGGRAARLVSTAHDALRDSLNYGKPDSLKHPYTTFWHVGGGVLDSTRDVAQAQARADTSLGFITHAASTGAVTSAHTRLLLQVTQSQSGPGHTPPPGRPDPPGISI